MKALKFCAREIQLTRPCSAVLQCLSQNLNMRKFDVAIERYTLSVKIPVHRDRP